MVGQFGVGCAKASPGSRVEHAAARRPATIAVRESCRTIIGIPPIVRLILLAVRARALFWRQNARSGNGCRAFYTVFDGPSVCSMARASLGNSRAALLYSMS